MAKPTCPECAAEGIEHIVSQDSDEQTKGGDAWFNVAFCNNCGHIYGVFAKIVHKPSPPRVPNPFSSVR